MKMSVLQQQIQAILFASGDPYDQSKLADFLNLDFKTLAKLIDGINNEFLDVKIPLQILKLDESYQMTSREEFGPIIKDALEIKKNTPLSQAALEVLAIIAYNQPVTKSFIEQVRGIDSGTVVNSLLSKELVMEAGRLELPGKPIAYKTTPNFLRCFSISSIEALPAIPERANLIQ